MATRNIRILFVALILSLPFWWGLNVFQVELTDFLYTRELAQPEFLAAQVSLYETERQLFLQRPILRKDSGFPDIRATAALSIYFDEDEREKELYAKNYEFPLPIASITKLMTALVVLERYPLDQVVSISKEALDVEGNAGYFRFGDSFTTRDLLYPLLIESSNDAAAALADIMGREAFVTTMNNKARELRLDQTVFVNTTGLDPVYPDTSTNYSTAKDLSQFSQYLFDKHPEIFDILLQNEFRLYTQDNQFHHTVYNTNILLDRVAWSDSIVGGKTGWTKKAQGTLLLLVKSPKEKGYIVHIILGAEDRFQEMRTLVQWTNESYVW